MNLHLSRRQTSHDGAFGALCDEDGAELWWTAEHAFLKNIGQGGAIAQIWRPIIPPGIYVCQRGAHQLTGMDQPFTTFEITGVAGHSKLLFHSGNLPQRDSEGCILLGNSMGALAGKPAVLDSRDAFAVFMMAQDGVDAFQLTVLDSNWIS